MDEETEETRKVEKLGEMHKQRELMEDKRRYIIYYTFGDEENKSLNTEENVNV